MPTRDLHYCELVEIGQRIRKRELSPVEATQAQLDRIARLDGQLKSYAYVMASSALEQAHAAEKEIAAGKARGPLHGVPIAVKDLCWTKDAPTAAGMTIYRDYRPSEDATVVSRLKEAGAVILGKLQLTEGAYADHHPEIDPPRNPWDATLWSGASSSGSGVATAAGLCYGSIGTDTGGSIRFPSAANGIVGLKPTYGRVSRYGVFPLAESLDHVGPMVRRAGDAAVMFEVIAGFDSNDPTSLRDPVPHMPDELEKGVRGLRVGFDRRFATEGIQPEQSAAIQASVDALRELGAQIVDVRMPDVNGVRNMWLILCAKEAVAAHAATFPSHKNEYGPYFREFLEMGAAVKAADYAKAVQYRRDLSTKYRAVLSTVDAFVYPAAIGRAHPISKEAQYGSMAEVNGARDKFANSYQPPLGANVYTYPAD